MLYRNVIYSGVAFGAEKWLTTLQRMCERLAYLMDSGHSTGHLEGGSYKIYVVLNCNCGHNINVLEVFVTTIVAAFVCILPQDKSSHTHCMNFDHIFNFLVSI